MSKQQFNVVIGESDLWELQKTPLSIEFVSRAVTKVNDVSYRIQDGQPFILRQFTDCACLDIRLKNTKYEFTTIIIEWVPLTVVAYDHKILLDNQEQDNPLPRILPELHEKGIDLRATEDPLVATHYLTLQDNDNYYLRIALARGLPILSTYWTDYIKRLPNDIGVWIKSEPVDPRFLPKAIDGENIYLVPDKRRSTLLLPYLIAMVIEEIPSKKNKKLMSFLECLGGTVMTLKTPIESGNVDTDQLTEELKSKLTASSLESCLMVLSSQTQVRLESLNTFFQSFGGEVIDDKTVLECVKSVTTGNLKPVTLHNLRIKKRESKEALASKPSQRRKRRKIEKANELDFFDFTPTQNQLLTQIEETQTQQTEQIEKSLLEQIIQSGSTVQAEQIEEQTEQENHPVQPEQTIQKFSESKGPSETVESHTEILTPTSGNSDPVSDENLPLGPKRTGSPFQEPETKRIKLERRKLKITPQISLVDAIKTTKKKQANIYQREFGIEEDEINEDTESLERDNELTNLAKVETVTFELRNPNSKPVETENRNWEGRKNFKKFSKTNKVLSSFSRAYVEMKVVPINNEVTFHNPLEDAFSNGNNDNVEKRLTRDFEGLMSEVKEVKGVESAEVEDADEEEELTRGFSFSNRTLSEKASLFVPEDSQESQTIRESLKQRNANAEDDIIEDDHDGEDSDDGSKRKFAFRRR